MGFNVMTAVPYARNLLRMDLLSKADIQYINKFHERCYKEVSPILNKHNWKLGLKWIEKLTKPI